jgi:hypothetical protein
MFPNAVGPKRWDTWGGTRDERPVYPIRCTSAGEYGGDGIAAFANIRHLDERFSGHRWYVKLNDKAYGEERGLFPGTPIHWRHWEFICQALETVQNGYPLMNEDKLYEIEDEWRDEAWESFLRDDVAKHFPEFTITDETTYQDWYAWVCEQSRLTGQEMQPEEHWQYADVYVNAEDTARRLNNLRAGRVGLDDYSV